MTPSPPGWTIEHRRGPAAELHRALPSDEGRRVWVLEVERPALVLGSTQDRSVLDAERVAAEGIEVAMRRSGGGAVLLRPDDHLWVDVVLTRDDPLWDDDVSRSSRWLGEAWVAALQVLGATDVDVHDGPMARRRLGRLVCFAGLAAGEVTVAGAKAVGISQRRTRTHARFQCVALLRGDVGAVGALLAPALRAEHGAALAAVPVATVPASLPAMVQAFAAALPA